jgi:hypothetical protein
MLSVNDGKVSALHRSDNDRCEFRPVEVLGDLHHVDRAASSNLPLVFGIYHQAFDSDPLQNGAGPGANGWVGELKRLLFSGLNMVGSKLDRAMIRTSASLGMT